MLLADIVGSRDGALLEAQAADTLDEAELLSVARSDQGDRDARLAGAGGSSGAMGVDGRVIGQMVVNDVGDVLNIQAARGNIGGHENADSLVAELAHHRVALGLGEVAVEGFGVDAIVHQRLAQLLGVGPRAAEDQAIHFGNEVDNPPQGAVAILLGHGVGVVLDIGLGHIARADGNLQGLVDVAPGDGFNFRRHRSREEPLRGRSRHALEDEVELLTKAQVEHLVSLVKDAGAHRV